MSAINPCYCTRKKHHLLVVSVVVNVRVYCTQEGKRQDRGFRLSFATWGMLPASVRSYKCVLFVIHEEIIKPSRSLKIVLLDRVGSKG